ncbi:MAG: hypothetical protein OMM_10211, partial [Candidatus Magnetoglobus multicellularis str. Araruama]
MKQANYFIKQNRTFISNRIKLINTQLILYICLCFLSLSCQPKPKTEQKTPDLNQHIKQILKNAHQHMKNKQYTKSLNAYQKVYEYYEKTCPKRCLHIQLKIADCYAMVTQSKAAENAYKQALELAKKHYGKIHKKVANVNHLMSLFYIDMGRYAKAKKCIESALGVDDFIYGPVVSPEKMDHLNTLALIFDHIGDFNKAQEIYQDIYERLKRKWGVHHLVTEAVISNLGGIYLQQKDYVKTEAFYKDALEITKKHKNESPELYARTLNNIAVLYKTIDEYSKAESFYYSALQIN